MMFQLQTNTKCWNMSGFKVERFTCNANNNSKRCRLEDRKIKEKVVDDNKFRAFFKKKR